MVDRWDNVGIPSREFGGQTGEDLQFSEKENQVGSSLRLIDVRDQGVDIGVGSSVSRQHCGTVLSGWARAVYACRQIRILAVLSRVTKEVSRQKAEIMALRERKLELALVLIAKSRQMVLAKSLTIFKTNKFESEMRIENLKKETSLVDSKKRACLNFLVGTYKSKQECALGLIRFFCKSSSQAELVTQHESIFEAKNSQWALKAQTYESEISTFQNIIGDLKNSFTDSTSALNLKIQTTQSENLTLQKKLSTVTEDSESALASQTLELDSLHTKLHSLQTDQTSMISEQNRLKLSSTSQIHSNELQISSQLSSLTFKTSEILSLKTLLETSQSTQSTLSTHITTLQNDHKTLQNTHKSTLKDYTNIFSQLKDTKKSLDLAGSQLAANIKICGEKEVFIGKLQGKYNNLEKVNGELGESIKGLREEVVVGGKEADCLRKGLDEVAEEKRELEMEIGVFFGKFEE
jgi:hypothetical protein